MCLDVCSILVASTVYLMWAELDHTIGSLVSSIFLLAL